MCRTFAELVLRSGAVRASYLDGSIDSAKESPPAPQKVMASLRLWLPVPCLVVFLVLLGRPMGRRLLEEKAVC